MGGKHFAVGIDIYTLILCLLQKLMHILKVMTRNNDKRSFFNVGVYTGWHRLTESAGVCLVEKLHTFEIYLAEFEYKGEPFLCGMFAGNLFEPLVEPV